MSILPPVELTPNARPSTEAEKSRAFFIAQIIPYEIDGIGTKVFLGKATGHSTIMSFDTGQMLTGKTIPFDTFIQIIDGNVDVILGGKAHRLGVGQCIVAPAHISCKVTSDGRFKLIVSVIKSGYEWV